jgi:8-oxo-dGTP diphosphatase
MRHDCSAIQEVSMILLRDGKVCLLRRANTGYEDGKYCFPAGHKEPGESPIAGAVREAFEEIGITVDPARVKHAHTMHRHCHDHTPMHERVAYFFTVDAWEGEPTNAELAKCDHLGWFDFDALPEMMPYMKAALGHIRAGTSYSEFGR